MSAGDVTPGRRVNYGDGTDPAPGDYWPATSAKFAGYWSLISPNGAHGMLNPDVHIVTEHEDGTITASPSVVFTGAGGQELWHGWLERGEWREV